MATCTECGRCQDQCPAWNTEKPLSPKLMMMALRDHTLSKTPYLLADEGKREALLEGDEALAKEVERPLIGDTGDDWFYMPEDGSGVIDPDVLWSCVTCGACVQQCPVDIEHVDHIVDMRRYQVLVESNFPAELNGLFKGLENKGNPWNMSSTARLDWAKDLPFDVKVVGEDVESLDEVEWLFWVGCAGAYEDRAKKTTRAVAELLDMAGVSFAVLGNGETCTGDSARRAGNEFVFQSLAAENIATFKETKVKKVVSTCAHCFNTLKNEYSQLGIELEVVHHTQLLNRLVREKKLAPVASNGGGDKRSITYHDPCYIGRHNGVYSPPRELLNVIPDATFTEMPRNSERSFCCGAGGARMWMEETIGTRINETRTMEAVETGADQIAVGCPFCRVMLSDGLTSAQSKGEAREEVEVLDVAQMLLASVKGESKPAAKQAGRSEAKAGCGAGGGTATATIEREDSTDEATKAEPEAGDTTQTEDTVTETEDVGPAAKASGGSSLFDLGGDDSSDDAGDARGAEPEARARARGRRPRLPVVARCSTSVTTTTSEAPRPRRRPEAEGGRARGRACRRDRRSPTRASAAVRCSTWAVTTTSSDASRDRRRPARTPPATPPPTSDVDRSEDDADTDVDPEAVRRGGDRGARRGSSIRHRLHPRHRDPRGRLALRHRGTRRGSGQHPRPGAETATEEPSDEPEEKAGEDAAGDSTTDERRRPQRGRRRHRRRTRGRARRGAEGRGSPPPRQRRPAPPPPPAPRSPRAARSSTSRHPPRKRSARPPRQPRPRPRSRVRTEKAGEDAAGDSTTDERRRPQRGRRRHRRRARAPRTRPTRTRRRELRRRPDHLAARHQGEVRRGRLDRLRRLDQRLDQRRGRRAPRSRRRRRRATDDEAEDEQEEKPKPASSGEAHQPKTDAEIKEGGSLFDL